MGFEPSGFIVSEAREKEEVDGLTVFSFSDIKYDLKHCGIIITVVAEKVKKEILANLSRVDIGEKILWHQQ